MLVDIESISSGDKKRPIGKEFGKLKKGIWKVKELKVLCCKRSYSVFFSYKIQGDRKWWEMRMNTEVEAIL